jgi:hypothetical protein
MKVKTILIVFLIALVITMIGSLFKILHLKLGPISAGILLLLGILLEMISAFLLLIKLLQTKDFKDFFNS